MQGLRRVGKVTLTGCLTVVFLVSSLLPKQSLRPAYAVEPVPIPLPAVEDPLGQQPEQSTPEISVNVDVRDGHLTVRVVDLWGPGRVPLVYRSYTNGTLDPDYQPATNPAPYRWQFTHPLDVIGTDVLEPGGLRSVYRWSSDRWNPSHTELWQVYVTDTGASTNAVGLPAVSGLFRTMEMHYTCDTGGGGNKAAPAPAAPAKPVPGAQGQVAAAPPGCVWDNTHVVYLPKGVVRRYLNRKIVEERDANGNVTTFTYTSFGDGYGTYLSTVTDPVGRQITYAWEHDFQKCVQMSGGDCVQWKWVYRVQRVTDGTSGRSASYSYNANGLTTSAVNGAGRTTSYTYEPVGFNSLGRLLSVTNARSQTTSVTWATAPSRVTQVTAPGGAATVYTHTVSEGRITRTVVRDALNHSTTYDIYAGGDSAYNGNLETVTDPLGNITRYAYDNRHNVTQVTDPRGYRTTYQYNSRNKVTQVVQAVGSLNLTTTATWDSNDNLLTLTNAPGIRTDYTYNSAHRVTSIRRAVGTADESLTQYTYNAWGGVVSVIDPLNHTTSYTYTARRQIQTVTPPAGGRRATGYNSVDDQTTMTNGNGRTWTTAYDASRLVTSVTDPQNHMIRHEYDNNGNRVRTYDGKNHLTTFNYDSRDRLTSIVDPLNGITAYQYDAVGNLTRITNARNHQTNFTYDNANRLIQVRDALNQTTSYGYDAASNRTSMQDRKGTNHAYTYDQANRLTQVSAGGTTISYTYSATGQRLTMVDPTGTTSYLYDSLDRLTRTTYPDGRTVQTAYDDAGNRTNLTYPGGTVSQSYTYDAANRLARITQGTLQWNFSYDGAGNRTQLTQPNGTSTIYAYLVNNWLQSIEHRGPGGGTIQAVSYTYDANDNRLTQTDAAAVTSFTYDGLDLTQAVYPAGYGTWTWTYDAVGNRAQQVAPGGTTGYAYDANNRLTQAANVVYTYDANGNLTSTTAGQSFTYNPFNQMTQATGPGGTVTNTYDGDGLKTRRVGPDGTTKYYYDWIRPIWETDSGGAMTAQLDRDPFGNLLSRKEPTARRYYHFDGLGSTTALTNESGTMAATMLYDAWGLQRTATGSGHGQYRFTGAEFDSATGLYHMGARFYDPNLGRWLSEDPVQDKFFEPNTLNFYAYVQNNPGIYVDPDGKVLILVAAGVAAVGAGLGLGLYLGSHQGSATVGGAIVWTGAGAAIGFGVGLAASYAATAGPGLSVVIARSIVDPARRVVAVMDRALARGWTSAENFLAHFEKHGQQVASAFGRTSVTMSEYAQLAKSALAQTGGGSGRVQLTWGGATHWVRIIVNEFGEVVSFFPTGPPK